MDSAEARKILWLYRPGLDEDDPQFAEALAAASRDPELAGWLRRRIETDAVVQERLAEMMPPVGLAAKILKERPVPFLVPYHRRAILQWAAIFLVLVALSGWWLESRPRNRFIAYEQYVARMLARNYRMSLESEDMPRIRSYLQNNQAPADFVLGPALQQATPLGCATLSWNANPVSMVCFADPAQRKVFLFVVNQGAIPDAPDSAAPAIRQVGDFATARWSTNGRAYLLTVKGGPDILQKLL